MRTRLTELLEIEAPVMLAGMGGVSYSHLVTAVSEAGGFGCIGAGAMSDDQMVEEIAAVAAGTDKPFGVDLLTAMPGDLPAQVQSIIDGGAKVFVAALGVPADVISMCHEADVLVANMCGKVSHAVRAVDAGCDLVIAQGTEAGGHTGRIATMPLVPQIVDAVGDRVPVAAAGGIYDGRGLAAALALGADGVWMGTRFIATHEARAVTGFKDRILAAREDQTTISRAYSGKTMRVIAGTYTDEWEKSRADELKPFPEQMVTSITEGALHMGGDETTPDVDPERECYPAGQVVGGIEELMSAADVVRSVVSEAEAVLAKASSLA
ncbi:MAG: NAD(P)H-dependent flavin oxidoreductase [Microthrixaceae bacterium]